MRITALLSTISILLVLQATSFGQCNPKLKADFSVNEICETDSATFVNLSQDAETFFWKFGDGKTSTKKSPKHSYAFVQPWGPIRALLVAIDSNGCRDSIMKEVLFNSNPKSDFSFTINQNEVKFKALQGGNTYWKWFLGNGDSIEFEFPNFTYTYTKPGNDTVCLKVGNLAGCFSKTCKEVKVSVGISHTIKPNDFKIYPNPNTGSFTININNPEKNIAIEIYDAIGEKVKTVETSAFLSSYAINLNLANGIYTVKITNVERNFNQRMIVNR